MKAEPKTDQEYVTEYMAALKRRGVNSVPQTQALKDRTLWPHLAPADAAYERADKMWTEEIDNPTEPESEVISAQPAEITATISAPEVSPAPAVTPAPRMVRPLRIVPTTTYDVHGRTFTDIGEAVLYAYTIAMEEVIGLPLDMDTLSKNAKRIHELTADYLSRTAKE